MNGNSHISLKEAIEKLLENTKLKGKLREHELSSSWEEIVGPMIARHTRELTMKRDVLVVKFDSAPLKQELIMMKSQLKDRLNEALGEQYIKDILIL